MPFDLEQFFRRQIPLTRAMEIRVSENTVGQLVLLAPLGPNRNDKGTAFAGTIAALSTLTGAAYTLVRLAEQKIDADVVIARSEHRYVKPGTNDLTAVCIDPGIAMRELFAETLTRCKKARWQLHVSVRSAGREIAKFEGEYVATLRRTHSGT